MAISTICPICEVPYHVCACEPIVIVGRGVLPNQRDADKYLKDNDAEKIGEVFVLREGHYAGQWAIKVSGKLYVQTPHTLGVRFKKREDS